MLYNAPLRVVHVDDDPGPIKFLRKQLETVPDIEYLASFQSAPEALEFLRDNRPDILFLDVEMPGHDGLWLARQMEGMAVNIVFLTAHTQYAMQAFEVCALDYLQKPPHIDRLRTLLDKIRSRPLAKQDDMHVQGEQIESIYNYLGPKQRPSRICINMVGHVKVIKLDEVIYFSSNNNYTTIIIKNGDRQTASKTIKTFEDALIKHPDFLRVSRSHIINKNFLSTIQRNSKTRRITITMENGEILETSYRTKEEIMALLA